MKKSVLLFVATISLLFAKAQLSQHFEGSESSLTGNCWTLLNVHQTTTPGDVINGTGSMFTNPPTSSASTRDITTPALNITSTSFSVSFNYKVSSKISGNATRTIEIGLLDVNSNFTSLHVITMDKNSPTTAQTFNQTFTLGSTGIRKLVLKLGGATGDGNSRLIFDDLFASANPFYGSGTCNSAPVAVGDVFAAPIGSVVSGNVMLNDSDPDGEAMKSFVAVTSADGTLVLNQNGSFTFTAKPGFTGSTTFSYSVQDAGFDPLTSNTATVAINFFAKITLPVKLLDFSAKYTRPNVLLEWSTSQEHNFSHFIIEQSTDGTKFSQTALVFGAGESNSRISYSYTDKDVNGRGGIIYYRLKQVDIDGRFDYSPVRMIKLGDERKEMTIAGFPNPVTNELHVTISTRWQGKAIKYELINTNGQLIKQTFHSSAGQTESITVSDLEKGIYFLRVNCNGETAIQKIIKN